MLAKSWEQLSIQAIIKKPLAAANPLFTAEGGRDRKMNGPPHPAIRPLARNL
ncbi:hypothetical protein JYU34_011270 [Plutella xylostella]|uniref:Uncharacterized protein n=1 Tax=Plutella xylostella TaxID=51655 RepID=A0ABQ7QGH7_PLUXY|nr:hypothetical protein JYU34_011270 [Plutella xylostella]